VDDESLKSFAGIKQKLEQKGVAINQRRLFHFRSEWKRTLGFTGFKLRPKPLFPSVVAFEFEDRQIRF